MAGRGYLGKISAVVTANTADLERKLTGGKRSVEAFARSLQGTIANASSSASRSLADIYTPLQKLQRALALANRTPVSLSVDDRKVRQLVSASEQIGKPLSSAVKEFSRLSAEVQSQLNPSLVNAQVEVQKLNAAIQDGGGVAERRFAKVERIVNQTTQAFARLREASSLVGSLATGNELGFIDPRFVRQQQEAASIQARAMALPADEFQRYGIRNAAMQVRSTAESAEIARARLENARLQAAQNPFRNPGNVQAAQDAYDDALQQQRFALTFYRENVQLAEEAVAAEKKREESLKRSVAIARELNDSFEFAKTGDAQNLQQAEQQIAKLVSQYDKLTEAQKEAADPALQRAIAAVSRGDLPGARSAISDARYATNIGQSSPRMTSIQAQVDQERRRRDAEIAANVGARSQRASLIPQGLFANRIAESLGPDAQAQSRMLDGLRGSITQAKSQLDELPASLRARFVPEIRAAEAEFIRLNSSIFTTDDEIQSAANSTKRLTDQLARAASIQQKFSKSSFQVIDEAQINRASGQLEGIRQVMLQVGATANGSLAKAYDRFSQKAQQAAQDGTLGSRRVQAELKREADLVAKLAAQTGKVSQSAASRTIQRAGDVGRLGLDRFSLAAQQAGFAIDDFFSVTGGLDQRLRAVSNNVSQLAFIIGGTTGLFVGLGITITAQVLLALSKFAFKSEEAEAAAKAMNSALDQQKSSVDALVQAYRQLGDEIAKSGMSEAAQRETQSRTGARDRARLSRDSVLATFAANSPRLAGARGEEATARKAREEATTPLGVIEAAQRERRAIEARRRAEAAAFADASSTARDAQRRAQGRGVSAQRVLQEDIDDAQLRIAQEDARGAGRRLRAVLSLGISTLFEGAQEDIGALRERVARSRAAQQLLSNEQGERFLTAGERFAVNTSPLAQSPQITETQGRIDSLLKGFEETITQIEAGLLSPGDLDRATQEFERLSQQLETAAIAVSGFIDALNRAATQLADTVVSELQSREDQLRRDANRAEAQFGANDPRTQQARRDEETIRGARRRAEEERVRIERQISEERQRFEQDLLNGRGNAEDRARADEIRRQRAIEQDTTKTEAERENARLRRLELEQQQNAAFENRPGVRAARRAADEFDIEAQRQQQRVEAAARGRELATSQINRDRQSIRDSARDLGIAQAEGGLGGGTMQAAANNLVNQFAPAFARLRDEVLNSRLQGPSRAALTVADVNTAEGSRELNRLLRGDDAARDVNLEELRTQSQLLTEIRDGIRNETGIVVDL